MFPRSFETPSKLASLAPQLVIATSQVVNHPIGVNRAKLTIQDGGASSFTNTGQSGDGGVGGDAAVYWVNVDPSTPWTVVIGAGGVGPGAATNAASNPGGASSVTPRGLIAYSTANAVAAGAIKIPGGASFGSLAASGTNVAAAGGSSFLSTSVARTLSAVGYGGGGGGVNANIAGTNGFQGVVIIEYIAPGA